MGLIDEYLSTGIVEELGREIGDQVLKGRGRTQVW